MNVTAKEIGFDRRKSRARKGRLAPHNPEPTANVIEWQRRQLEPLDRYLATKLGSVEALELLSGLLGIDTNSS